MADYNDRIDFQGQFRILRSADTSQQLKEGLAPEQHRQYGETLHANSVFDAAFRSPAIKELEVSTPPPPPSQAEIFYHGRTDSSFSGENNRTPKSS